MYEPTRDELLERLALVCLGEECDEMTDYEEVVRNHRRLAKIALGWGREDEEGKGNEK